MNLIFSVIFLASMVILTIINPSLIIPTLNAGVKNAFDLSLELFLVYALWIGVFELIESGGIGPLLAKILHKPVRLIFGKTSDEANKYLCLNMSANLLGIGGVATPMGIEAQCLLEKENNTYAQNMLFVVASSSLQLLPISVMGLKSAYGSLTPQDIILPSFLSTLVSTLCGILLVKVFCKK